MPPFLLAYNGRQLVKKPSKTHRTVLGAEHFGTTAHLLQRYRQAQRYEKTIV